MFPVTEWLVIAAAYGIGCLTAGYYLVRFLAKKDIHEIGSGNVGARNVSRVLGSPGFIATLVIDLLKGMAAVWIAQSFGVGPYWLIAAYLAVIAGHIWPVQLRFRGGKGIATAIGVMLMLGPLTMGLVIIQFLCIYVVNRSFTISGLFGIAVTPFTLLIFGQPVAHVVGIAALAVLVCYSHRENLAARLKKNPS
ncbi:MAG TPA: glycerol-3-phosphate acyltransferase [Bacillales bacterium]|nr:glycerol-3-phosphate acyltransferase [Bacillales bacterium]